MNKKICVLAFLAGAFAVLWVGIAYISGHPLAFAMTLLIGTVYALGSLELLRFHQATLRLQQALGAIPETLSHLGEWLEQLPAVLQNPVRLRVEGERAALPGPAVTPYLVGLLVMLGMLGTFLGMVVTLNGAVLALESTTDLATIRAALAAPVKGLGLAFGTSVAGVATSAMLGLISALCRRERQQVGQLLDRHIATTLREYSLVYQRQETFKAIRAQSQALPEVAGQLQAMMTQLQEQNRELQQRLLANQEGFHKEAQAAYGELARSVDQSLKASLMESARAAGAAIQPVVEGTMATIARETAALQEKVAHTVESRFEGMASRFDGTVSRVADTWQAALQQQASHNEQLNGQLQTSLGGFAATFEQRSTALLADLQNTQQQLQGKLAEQDQQRQAALAQSLEALAASLKAEWQQAGAETQRQQQAICQTLETSAQRLQDNTQEQARQTLAEIAQVAQSAGEAPKAAVEVIRQLQQLQADQAGRDEARQAALTQSLATLAASLKSEWQQAGSHSLEQQQQICQTLEATAARMAEQAQAQARDTLQEISRLMETAAEAPKVAAEVIAQLRQQLSQSVAQDNALLEERSRTLETLNSLLATVNQAATEQRGAIDALVASAGSLLEKAGQQFGEQVAGETARLTEAAAQTTGSAAEVASLGEAFGAAVQQFGQVNETLVANLERIEGALEKSMARSDEQLAYYVAQAREIIDLSIMSQKQVVDELRQVAANSSGKPVAGEAA